jgi:hypothetical protein
MQTTVKNKANKILEKGIFIYQWEGKKPITQYYQIDLNKPCKIGGIAENGYCLKHFTDGSKSNTVISYINALKIAKGETLTINNAKVFFKPNN